MNNINQNHSARAVIECSKLQKTFKDGVTEVQVLKNINLTVHAGECVAIVGASGEGKSTLLHLLGGLDHASAGEIKVDGENLGAMTEKKRCEWRNRKLGFIYQFHHLLPEFTALENVCMPLLIRNECPKVVIPKAKEILTQVGLSHRLQHKIGELSGGERQRTAIARALITSPLCVLADEPTGNLDHKTAEQVYLKMLDLNRNLNTSLLIVTHDLHLAKRMDRILKLEDGVLIPFS